MDQSELLSMLRKRALGVRQSILEMAGSTDSSHAVSALSEVEILVTLFGAVLRHDPGDPTWPERDRFILSKGHGCEGLYAVLALSGYFDPAELKTYKKFQSKFPGHPNRLSLAGVEASTGALGHGLSLGVGMALASRMGPHRYRVFVLMGDGELNEGQVWEAAMLAAHFGLENLVAIVDRNGLQNDGPCATILNTEPLLEKWKSFRWEPCCCDGHNFEELLSALRSIPLKTGKPSVIIARTVKGKGVSFLENRFELHNTQYSQEQITRALAEVAESEGSR